MHVSKESMEHVVSTTEDELISVAREFGRSFSNVINDCDCSIPVISRIESLWLQTDTEMKDSLTRMAGRSIDSIDERDEIESKKENIIRKEWCFKKVAHAVGPLLVCLVRFNTLELY